MPCRDEGQSADQAIRTEKELKAKIDELTRMLCHAMKWATRPINPRILSLFSGPVGADLKKWWHAHMEVDRRRDEAEEARAARRSARALRIAELEAETIRLVAEQDADQ